VTHFLNSASSYNILTGDGINALDALIIAYTATSALRQQTQPGDIIQGQIINGGLR